MNFARWKTWIILSHVCCQCLPKSVYSLKLLREKGLPNFEVLCLFVKVFSMKFGGVVSFDSTSEQSVKVFFTIFQQFVKVFSKESYPLYNRLSWEGLNCQEGTKLVFLVGNPSLSPEREH